MKKESVIKSERKQQAIEIATRLKKCSPHILMKYPVDVAYLHGSVARGQPLPTSDIDIALVLSEIPSPYERLQLELEIQAELEDVCGLSNLDVRTINDAPIMAQGPIVQQGILLYNRDKAQRVAFEVLIRSKYFDFQPVAKRLQQAFFKRIREEGFTRGQREYHRHHPKQSE
jgi:predicted nucleotidyltransferase